GPARSASRNDAAWAASFAVTVIAIGTCSRPTGAAVAPVAGVVADEPALPAVAVFAASAAATSLVRGAKATAGDGVIDVIVTPAADAAVVTR
ncbi:hypothetical protein ABTH30_20825, partial [Acinetobacter baumannii]